MARSLEHQVLVVTGASSGIGRATALEAAAAGMDLVLSGRREDRLRDVAMAVHERGRRAVIVPGDVAAPGFSSRILDEASRAFGGFDAVFANAGYGAEVRALAMPSDDLRRMFDVNFFAACDLVGEAARRLVAARRAGHLLMCSSCVARYAIAGYAAYAASKAAQALYCQALRYELKPLGIHVSTVHPVTTTTEFFAVAASKSGEAGNSVADHAPQLAIQPPERVARAVIKCLRRPRREVWTFLPAQLGAGIFSAFPRVADWFLAPYVKYLPNE